MKSDFYFYLTAAVGFLIVVLFGFLYFGGGFPEYRYSVTSNGVDFVSNSAEPNKLLLGLRDSGQFIVAPQFSASGPENSYMASSLTMFNSVLISEGKKAITVGRVLDEKGNIASCQTNLGDPKTSKDLDAQECTAMLSDASGPVVIFVSFPNNPKLKRPLVMLSERVVRITPSSFDNVSYVSYTFLSSLYPDSASAIANVNSIVRRI